MPLYEYLCETCHTHFEVRRHFSDIGVPACPHCNGTGKVRKVFSMPAIVFKGSGFYVTDSRGKNSAATHATSKDQQETASANGKTKDATTVKAAENSTKKESSKKD